MPRTPYGEHVKMLSRCTRDQLLSTLRQRLGNLSLNELSATHQQLLGALMLLIGTEYDDCGNPITPSQGEHHGPAKNCAAS